MISGSGEFVDSSLINNPQTFITTIGLYNDAVINKNKYGNYKIDY